MAATICFASFVRAAAGAGCGGADTAMRDGAAGATAATRNGAFAAELSAAVVCGAATCATATCLIMGCADIVCGTIGAGFSSDACVTAVAVLAAYTVGLTKGAVATSPKSCGKRSATTCAADRLVVRNAGGF